MVSWVYASCFVSPITVRSYIAVAIILLLQGCVARYADFLFDPSDTSAWASSLNHVELVNEVFSHAEYGKRVKALVQTTSGFHFEGYAVFLEGEIRFTTASFKTVTHKAEAHYDEMHLEWIVLNWNLEMSVQKRRPPYLTRPMVTFSSTVR